MELPPFPQDLPAGLQWGGWLLALILLYFRFVAPHRLAKRADTRAEQDQRFHLQKQKLELLKDETHTQSRYLELVVGALSSDVVVSEEAIEELRQAGDKTDEFTARHLLSRKQAREELPEIVKRLNRIRGREASLRQQLVATGHPLDDDPELTRLREDLNAVGEQVAQVLRRLVESPRIFVQEEEPSRDDLVEGDLWFQTQPSQRASGARHPPSSGQS